MMNNTLFPAGLNQVMRKTLLTAVTSLTLIGGGVASAQTLDINRILAATNSAANQDRQAQQAREQKFNAEQNRQRGRLNAMRGERTQQERLSDQLERSFEANEVRIEELQADLARELGDLKELFGVIQQTASEAQEDYKTSAISAHYPERSEDLRQMVAKMASLTDLVSIDEIENLWVQLQTEMTEQGKIVKFTAPVTYLAGTEVNEAGEEVQRFATEEREVTRVGVFSLVSGDDIARYDNDKGLVLLDRKMPASFTSRSQDLQSATSGVTSFPLDPTKGALLSAFVLKPSLIEKVQEGGYVGYVIIALGVLALIIAVLKLLMLTGVEGLVRKQAKDLKRPSLKNPLGRVIKVYQDNPQSDPESMELKLSEAILKESPKLNSWVMFIKIIAVVAPLLGLLGTVTGMIQTFQAITLFGAGDPQTMAGGISQALVTTVLGLVVAIPTVFMHWLVSGRARRIEATLEETASGLVAEQYQNHS